MGNIRRKTDHQVQGIIDIKRANYLKEILDFVQRSDAVVTLADIKEIFELTENQMISVRREFKKIDDNHGAIRYVELDKARSVVYVGDTTQLSEEQVALKLASASVVGYMRDFEDIDVKKMSRNVYRYLQTQYKKCKVQIG